ncbi:hypothetical protein K431DRAFT_301623 [Polychaeton citri CBS 116435]|uniref:F-box domain-containing protein n=1 Tax=Polychaeton citri CBS 116435 TaxID=1314669 RepID=A0A9P4UPR6_9PEZI|nr:hypothetical protein K431DRAFT_301623 [Polychaeton citri CBS 116435]
MEKSPLRRVPREVRDEIYKYILIQSTPIEVHLTPGEKYYFCDGPFRSNYFNIASICRQLRQESEPILWANNSFILTLDEPFVDGCYGMENTSVQDFITIIGADTLRSIRSLSLRVMFGRNGEHCGQILQLNIHDIMGHLPKTYLQLNPQCAALWKEAWTFLRLIHPRATMGLIVRMGFLDLAIPFHDPYVAKKLLGKIGIQRMGGRFYGNEKDFDRFWTVVEQSIFQPRIIDTTPKVVLFQR